MWTTIDWQSALSDAATEILQSSEVIYPPIDAMTIARKSGLQVALDQTQSGRGRIKRISGQPVIFLRPDDRPERLQWAAAHELGESLVWRVCRSLGIEGTELPPRPREELANQLAQEILLPREWFQRDCQRFDYDLTILKTHYRTASHELIAWRWLDLEVPTFVSVFDQGHLSRRRSNRNLRPPSITPFERDAWETLRETRRAVDVSHSEFRVQGWCVDSPGWQREILVTRLLYDTEFSVDEFE